MVVGAQDPRGPRSQPNDAMSVYAPSQLELYDGRFIIRGARVYEAGTLGDRSPWDHMGDDGKIQTVKAYWDPAAMMAQLMG